MSDALSPPISREVWHIASDLMMSSSVKIVAARNQLGYRNFPSLSSIERIADEVYVLMVDLQVPGLELEKLRQLCHKTGSLRCPVYLYAQHVDTQALDQARTAGFEGVMTRGQFFRSLESLLSSGENPAQPRN